MLSAHRYSRRLIRCISLSVSLALLTASFALAPVRVSSGKSRRGYLPFRGQGGSSQGQERRVTPLPPQPGPPQGNLPNLDQLRSVTDLARSLGTRVQAPRPVPSTLRARRKARWLTPERQLGSNRVSRSESPASSSHRERFASKALLAARTSCAGQVLFRIGERFGFAAATVATGQSSQLRAGV